MSVDESLASASNALVYSAMAVYTLALGASTMDLAALGDRASARMRKKQQGKSQQMSAGVAGGGGTATVVRTSASEEPISLAEDGASRKVARIAVSLTVLALLLHIGGVVTRGLSAHRAPWGNMYEFSVTGTSVVVLVYLLVLTRRDVRWLSTFVLAPVLLSLGLAVAVFYTDSAPLVPALQSYWLVIHVSVAFISISLFVLAFSTTVLQLVQERREIKRAAGETLGAGRFMEALPTSTDLEKLSYRLIAISFPLWGFTLVAGAIWAEVAWGRYWNWDPKEVWTFIIWVVYAAYLHARATGGWNGRRAAYLSMAGFACIIINYVVVNVFFPGNHSYAGIG
ncbi:cytochrome c-type biogenesis protein CcsB [Quadrisphaera granulorum]|uniref:Cytochrome c-type biogenesis protein CcsB n=1 Tax=Quadrisphaera granulorum TaxID=317664 RepID=A0A316A6D2_9ACTN|nr:c-type cytochrome biogenesis protein CcsB [Quadrisphaera granulorum]PWJ53245.1 cytochrome c-type biogenesis protein CcsB [Quadrisphaera granulorum]SZE96919.1 cytochrome c-type biogenesis protein CcsB [Quadrisphaera granulorum]